MNRLNDNVIDIGTRFLAANTRTERCESAELKDPRLAKAVEEMRLLWQATDSLVRGSRDSLYEFLGATYEHAATSSSGGDLALLRATVRQQYTGDRQKKPVAKRQLAQTKDGFTVVLFYTDPRTKQVYRLAELADDSVVDKAIRLAQAPEHAPVSVAAAA